ncbi:hypothetical protein EON81_03690 [bacterium]|nr:MAG: hypothetical protein EON81_03690 [bacterium]
MRSVRSAALALLFSLPILSAAQIPWTPLWSLPAMPRGEAIELPVSGDLTVNISGRNLVCRSITDGSIRWNVPLANAEYMPVVAIGADHVAVRRAAVLEVRRLSDGSLVRATTLSAIGGGLAIRGDRIHTGNQVLTWPECVLTSEASVMPEHIYNGQFSANGKYFAGQSSWKEVGVEGTRYLQGRRGQFSADSSRIYSHWGYSVTNYARGAVFGQRTSDGALLWTFETPSATISSAQPMGNDKVLVLARLSDSNGNDRGQGAIYVLNGATGAVLSAQTDIDHFTGDPETGATIVAARPGLNRVLILSRANRTWALRAVDVSASGVPTLSPVIQYEGGTGVDFAGDRPVVFGRANDLSQQALGTVYLPDGTIDWRSAIRARPAWVWTGGPNLYGAFFTPDGKLGADLGPDGYLRTYNAVSGTGIAHALNADVPSYNLFPLFGGGAIGDYNSEARYYRRSGNLLNGIGQFANALPIGVDTDGKRFVLSGRFSGEMGVFKSSDAAPLFAFPAGSLPTNVRPRVALNGNTLTTLTVVQGFNPTYRATATVWTLATPPVKVRTVTRDFTPGTGMDYPSSLVAGISPDGRLMLVQPRFSGYSVARLPFELVRLSDGKTVSRLVPTGFLDQAIDLALSRDGSRAILALENGSHYSMPLPGIVSAVEANVRSRTLARVTVRLMAPAPPGGSTVRWRFTPNLATGQSPAVIPAGATYATFDVNLGSVAANTNLKVEAASAEDDWAATTIQLQPPVVASLTAPAEIEGGNSLPLRINLDGPAPAGGTEVTLSSNQPYVLPPATTTVPAGQSFATVPITTNVVAADGTATLTGGGGGGGGKSVTVKVFKPMTAVISPRTATVKGGESITLKVVLSRAAPAGGVTVLLSDKTSLIDTPPSVNVPAGSREATFTVATRPVASIKTSTVYTSVMGRSGQSGTLKLTP